MTKKGSTLALCVGWGSCFLNIDQIISWQDIGHVWERAPCFEAVSSWAVHLQLNDTILHPSLCPCLVRRRLSVACINPTDTVTTLFQDLVLSFCYMLWRRAMTDIQQLIPGTWTSTSHLLVFCVSGCGCSALINLSFSLRCDHENKSIRLAVVY